MHVLLRTSYDTWHSNTVTTLLPSQHLRQQRGRLQSSNTWQPASRVHKHRPRRELHPVLPLVSLMEQHCSHISCINKELEVFHNPFCIIIPSRHLEGALSKSALKYLQITGKTCVYLWASYLSVLHTRKD